MPYSLSLSLCSIITLLFVSDRLEQIVSQLSKQISSAICTLQPGCEFLQYILSDLTRMKGDSSLTEAAYKWCSLICENYSSFTNGRKLVLLALQVGFRHLDPGANQILAWLIHTEHHQELVHIVFGSRNCGAITDLLQAWTSSSFVHQPFTLLKRCTPYLIDPSVYQYLLGGPESLPAFQRSRQLVIRTVELIGLQGCEQGDLRGFCEFLDFLHVSTKDIVYRGSWAELLLDIINQSPQGAQYLSQPYWELLAELSTSVIWWMRNPTWNPDIMVFLEGNQEWDKLEIWMGVIWIVWPQKISGPIEGDVRRIMLSLFHQRPGAIQKLRKWMDKGLGGPEIFQKICEQGCHEAVQKEEL